MAGALFVIKVGVCLSAHGWPATAGQADGCRGLGARRGQRCVRSVQSPADGGASPGRLAPWGLPRLYALRGIGMRSGAGNRWRA